MTATDLNFYERPSGPLDPSQFSSFHACSLSRTLLSPFSELNSEQRAYEEVVERVVLGDQVKAISVFLAAT